MFDFMQSSGGLRKEDGWLVCGLSHIPRLSGIRTHNVSGIRH